MLKIDMSLSNPDLYAGLEIEEVAGRANLKTPVADAAETERRFGDYVEAWEIRTGRPWTEMTRQEAEQLLTQRPHLMGNPGVLSRLL